MMIAGWVSVIKNQSRSFRHIVYRMPSAAVVSGAGGGIGVCDGVLIGGQTTQRLLLAPSGIYRFYSECSTRVELVG